MKAQMLTKAEAVDIALSLEKEHLSYVTDSIKDLNGTVYLRKTYKNCWFVVVKECAYVHMIGGSSKVCVVGKETGNIIDNFIMNSE